MGTMKSDLFEICKEIVKDIEGWSFVSGIFKNKALKHTQLEVAPLFGFKYPDSAVFQPVVVIYNKRAVALTRQILGHDYYDAPTSGISFKYVMDDLKNTPQDWRGYCWIEKDKQLFMKNAPSAKDVEYKLVDITEVRPLLKATLLDGIFILQKYFDFSSEMALLNGLPPKYTPSKQLIYDEMERNKGIKVCIVRLLLGDFDFVEQYASDDYKTVFPKRMTDLNKILSALPDLKRRYAETGSVI